MPLLIVEDEPKTSIVSSVDFQINGPEVSVMKLRTRQMLVKVLVVETEAPNNMPLFFFSCVELLNDI